MLLTQIHQFNKFHKFFKELDHLCFLSKNLYNFSNYLIRQHFLKTKDDLIPNNNNSYLNYYDINRYMVDNQQIDYIQLPRKVSNSILRLLDKNYVSFFKANKEYKIHPQKFLGRPKLPKYKNVKSGRNIVPYQKGAISKSQFKKYKLIHLSGTNIKIKTNIKSWNDIQSARIIPTISGYKVEIIYNKQININKNNKNILGLDLGVNNLVAGYSTNNKSFLINGRILKSINHYYNKKKAKIQQNLDKLNLYTSKKLKKLTNKRNNKINDYLHKCSKKIIDYCLTNNIGKIILGHNKEWKQQLNMNKINNQNFVQIPFNILINQLKYKGQLNNIDLIMTEQSYTSKCSFIDNQSIEHHQHYKGKRIKRGLFKSLNGSIINADINGALNIIRKVLPQFNVSNTLYQGIQGIAVYPTKLFIQ